MNAPSDAARPPLRILMSAGVPRRREGGVASTIYNLGEELQRRGHAISYVFNEDLVGADYRQHRFSDLVLASRLERYITQRRGEFSVVNLHAPIGFLYGLRRRWSPAGLPPYVLTLHGLEERRLHVLAREAAKGRARNWGPVNRLWHRVYTMPRFRWCVTTADGANSCARDVWNLLQLEYDLDADRTAYTPHGVQPRFFVSRQPRPPGPLKLLYAGTWLEQRGVHYLREALPRLAARLPGLKMTFVGVGGLEPEVRAFFGPQLAATIDVVPSTPSEKMHEVFAAHDVFLFPSLMEGLPSVVLEAMASGMPVITTETCGMPDVIDDGVDGLLIPPADSQAIEDAVLRLAEDPELARRLGVAAQERMRRQTWERAAAHLEALFHRVVAAEARA
jgi:glycosyltransferase involved in cell wall biosynthesis